MRRRLLFIGVLVVLCLLVVPVSADWLDGWAHRKSHVINNTGGELTNYQMNFTIYRSYGSDSGADVYIGLSGCQDDYDDIRFTTSDGTTLLDYWIEESDSNEADIWVEVDTIAASGNTVIYLYYGNAGASAYSNGENTFDFFDDFPGSSLDTEKWDVGLGVFVVSDSKVTLSDKSHADTDLTFGTNVIIEGYGKIDENVYNYLGFNIGSKYARWFGHYSSYTNRHIARSVNTGDESFLSANIDDTSYHRWTVGRTTSSFKYFRNGGLAATHTAQYFSDAANIRIGGDSGAAWEMDWILVRKYAATEPTCSEWGSEEALYKMTADFSGVPTSGIVPLTVYFADSSVSSGNTTIIIDEWSWDFGDESAGSSDQNPAHQYTTSGTYTVALTASNTTYGTTDTETKTDYITVSIDTAAPTADFVATPLCEDIGEPIYFLDYSTGGGLYAWNWSFGDGDFSELRNPTHSYSTNGTYDIGLTVWGANGTDTETKTGYITIPCGAPTPTPTTTATTATPTPTPTGTIPVQGDVDTGRISPLGFVMLAFLNLGLVLHTFVNNESRNYLHVFTGIVAVIVSFLLGTFLITGFVQEDFVVTAAEVTVNSSVLSTYQVEQVSIIDAGVGYYFVFIGILMTLIVILSVIEIIREIQEG